MRSLLRRVASLRSRRRSLARVGARRGGVRCVAFELLEPRTLLTGLPFGAMDGDTAEYMLGKVLVTPVFFESDGSVDPDLEDWTPALIEAAKAKIETGLQWWVDTLAATGAAQTLEFVFDYTFADNPVATAYEPISRISNDYALWGQDFLELVGYNSGAGGAIFNEDIRQFNHAQRTAHDTDWAFAMFVVNSELDADDSFAAGGSFSRAFAFAGGLFFVSPSDRPASTFSHETGHIFYAKDEYLGAGSYLDFRGYYNTQNLNAANNPDPDFVQADSIMATGQLLENAYANHTSSHTTLEMIGWRDSDGDGIFDVLDAPHTLSGSGYYDARIGAYRFVGASSVQTLPNLNPSGLGNDITINEISRAEYRVDGGPWLTAAVYHARTADLDLTISLVASEFQTIEIRTVDEATGVSSPVFLGGPEQASSVGQPGINGFVWRDQNVNGVWDVGELGLPGWTVQIVGQDGLPLSLEGGVEPDDYTTDLQLLNDVNPAVSLSAIGDGVADGSVLSRQRDTTLTGSRVFAHFLWGGQISAEWTASSRKLKITFDSPVTTVSLDAVSNSDFDYGRLEIYDAAGRLLGRYTTQSLAQGASETMTLSRPTAEIAYAIASAHAGTAVQFDNLCFGPQATTTTDGLGAFSIPYLEPGAYTVHVTAPDGWSGGAAAADQSVVLQAGEIASQVNFGFQYAGPLWQNPVNRYDVNDDGVVSIADAVVVINDLNAYGVRELSLGDGGLQRYLDVSGDGFVSPHDALLVINLLNQIYFSGPALGSGSGNAGGEGSSEGEFELLRPSIAADGWPDLLTPASAPAAGGDSLPAGLQSNGERDSGGEPAVPEPAESDLAGSGWEWALSLIAAEVDRAWMGERPAAAGADDLESWDEGLAASPDPVWRLSEGGPLLFSYSQAPPRPSRPRL